MKFVIFLIMCFFSSIGFSWFLDNSFPNTKIPVWITFSLSGILGALAGWYLL